MNQLPLDLLQVSTIYSIVTKILALVLIAVITPVVLQQLTVRRLYRIKLSMLLLASVTFCCVLFILYYQLNNFLGHDVVWLLPYVQIANSTSLLTTAGAMFVIYKATGE